MHNAARAGAERKNPDDGMLDARPGRLDQFVSL